MSKSLASLKKSSARLTYRHIFVNPMNLRQNLHIFEKRAPGVNLLYCAEVCNISGCTVPQFNMSSVIHGEKI